MTKYAIGTILTLFFAVFHANGQNTYSPYSSLGIGEIVSSDYARTAGMGGIGIGIRNNTFLNTTNPAGVAAIDSTTGIFDVGLFGKNITLKSRTYNDNAFSGNFNKIALGFRAGKRWGISAGIKPFSNVGYHIQKEEQIDGTEQTQKIYLEGDGGLYNLYLINAVEIIPQKLSLGVMTSMIAGKYTHTIDQISYSYVTTSRTTQVYNKFGLQYQLANKMGDWVVGATYGYKQSLAVKNRYEIYSGGSPSKSEALRTTDQFIPENYGLGISLKKEKFLFAAEGEVEKWNGLESNSTSIRIRDAYKFKAGVGYTPYKDLYTAHLAKQYQFGVAVNKSYIEVKNQAAWNYAVSTGISFPLRAGQTQRGILNFGIEYGSNLSAPSGYLKENYVMLNINFSFIEAMFMRSKIF